MSPETFQELLDRETATPPPPPAPGSELTAGRRRLRRQRGLTAGAAVLTVVAVAGGASLALSGGTGRGHAQDPVAVRPPEATRPVDQASLLESCRGGNQSPEATRAVFGAGTPRITGVAATDLQVILTLAAADGRHWAECFVHLTPSEFASGMTVFDGAGTSTALTYSSGPGCGLVDGEVDRTCTTWSLSTSDRLPEAVAAVRYDLGDGSSTTVQSRDGFVVLNLLRPLPDGTAIGPDGDLPPTAGLARVTYLGADGRALAAQATDGSGSGPDHEVVDGLPTLSAYPSLRAEQPIY